MNREQINEICERLIKARDGEENPSVTELQYLLDDAAAAITHMRSHSPQELADRDDSKWQQKVIRHLQQIREALCIPDANAPKDKDGKAYFMDEHMGKITESIYDSIQAAAAVYVGKAITAHQQVELARQLAMYRDTRFGWLGRLIRKLITRKAKP